MSDTSEIRFGNWVRDQMKVDVQRLPILALLYVLCVVVPIEFQVGPLAMSALRVFLLAVTIPLVIGLISGRFGKIILTDYLMFAHIAWGALALSINNPQQVVEQAGSVGMEFIGGYLLGRATIRTKEDFLALCRVLAAIIILVILPLALVENFTYRALGLEFLRALPGLDSPAKVRPDPRLGLFRAQSLFAHAIHSGLFCSISISLCFIALQDQISNTKRWICTILIVLATFTSISSGALLAGLLQLGLIAWYVMFKNVQAKWWILFGLGVVGYMVIELLSNRSAITAILSRATFSAHNAYWRMIIFDWGLDNVIGNAERGIPAAPWFGIGLNDWIRPYYMYSGSMDNFWLVMTVRYGLPGFLFLAIGYVLGLARIMRRNLGDDSVLQNCRRAWVFTFLGLTFTLCTVHVWTNIYSFVFFMFGAGIWFITVEPEAKEASNVNTKEDVTRMRRVQRLTRFDTDTARESRSTRRLEKTPTERVPSASSLARTHKNG